MDCVEGYSAIVPVAAVADTVMGSTILVIDPAKTLDDPVKLCVPVQVFVPDKATVDSVPDVGRVTFVVPVVVKVKALAPDVVRLPAKDKEPVTKVKDDPDPVVFNNVPDVGNVTAVVPVTVRVVPKLPEIVTVLAALLATPVPPKAVLRTPVELAPSARNDILRGIVMFFPQKFMVF